MSLADIIAKKKAAEAATTVVTLKVPVEVAKAVAADKSGAVAHLEVEAQKMQVNQPAPTKEGIKPWPYPEQKPAVAQSDKPLSFAEKMALKRSQEQVPAVSQEQQTTAMSVSSSVKETVAPVSSGDAKQPTVQAVPVPVKENTGVAAPSIETAQAYADIKVRIDTLAELSDMPLENAMKDLKKSLLANPNAVSLMLDTDYGKMVVALRRWVQEDVVEAAKEKKPGGRKKKENLDWADPDAVQAVFDEL